jgi:hypothetical protein
MRYVWCFSFLLIVIGCSLSDTKDVSADSTKQSLLELKDQDGNLDGFYADSLYCKHLEETHTKCKTYLSNFRLNDSLLHFSDSLLHKKNKSFNDTLESLNYLLNRGIQKFNQFYPNVDTSITFADYCGGYCEPVTKAFGFLVLPDRTVETAEYWKDEKRRELFSRLLNKAKFYVSKLAKILSGDKDISGLYPYKSNIKLINSKPQKLFKGKTAAEVLIIMSNIQEALIKLKIEVIRQTVVDIKLE